MNQSATPQSLVSVDYVFPAGAVAAAKAFARAKPWRGEIDERRRKFEEFHAALSSAYGSQLVLEFHGTNDNNLSSGRSRGQSSLKLITLSGRLSVITYLFCFATAGGVPRKKALTFAINLFSRAFPRSFQRLQFNRMGLVEIQRVE